MPIRVTGMISGLDTEALVSAMVSAYSVKKQKSEKNVQTLKWKQEAWTSMNAKIKSLYSSVSSLRFSSAYSLKKATVSDSSKATATAGANATIGSQKLVVKQLATSGYLTGAQIKKNNGESVTSSTKLSELLPEDAFTGDKGSISVKVGGSVKNIEVGKDTTVSSFVNSLKDAGVSANFDEKNGRFFVSAKNSGADNDFTLVSNDGNGLAALNALGLNVQSDANEALYAQYAAYKNGGNLLNGKITSIEDLEKIQLQVATNKEEIADKKTENSDNSAKITYAKDYQALRDTLKELPGGESGDYATQLKDLLSNKDLNKFIDQANGNKLYDREEEVKDGDGNVIGFKYYYKDEDGEEKFDEKAIDGKLKTINDTAVDLIRAAKPDAVMSNVQEVDEDGNPVVDEDGNPVYVQAVDAGGNSMEDAEGNPVYEQAVDDSKIGSYLSGIYTRLQSIKAYEDKAGDDEDVAEAMADVEAAYGAGGIQAYIDGRQAAIDTNNEEIAELEKINKANSIATTGEDNELILNKLNQYSQMNDDIKFDKDNAEAIANGDEVARTQYSAGAVRVNAVDAQIELNGAAYTSSTNNFSINDLSINVTGTTDEDGVSITTDTDTQAIYDKVKDFLKQYNELVNEMAKLYNADSSKGYEPLTDEEKDAMSDTEVEKWEQKIKDSILRKDQTLGSVMNAMTASMSKRYEINGKYYSLSSFGIKTKNYFETDDNDNYAYHIDGDKDDTYSSGNADKLLAAITADADGVVDFFKQLTSGLYTSLDQKMKGTTMSSAYSVYNDKQMKTQLATYEKEVTSWENKIQDYEDYWYNKYASMESTLAKLQSSTSSLSSMMG